MLEMFMSNQRQIISPDRFMEKIWGFDSDTEQNVVWVYISYLRKKLAKVGANVQIKAARNMGYSLEAKMIKSLRRKFIAIAMCSLIGVLVLTVGFINTFSYIDVVNKADSRLSLIEGNNGTFPKNGQPPKNGGMRGGEYVLSVSKTTR